MPNFLTDFEINEFAIHSFYYPNYFAPLKFIQLIRSVWKQLLALNLNSLIQNLLNFRNDKKNFLEALRTKFNDSLISCGRNFFSVNATVEDEIITYFKIRFFRMSRKVITL